MVSLLIPLFSFQVFQYSPHLTGGSTSSPVPPTSFIKLEERYYEATATHDVRDAHDVCSTERMFWKIPGKTPTTESNFGKLADFLRGLCSQLVYCDGGF